ncbi:diacylglycerol kinase family lipid kinase [Mucilaginibacter rubeus]|uniref:Diacylglycerol kinase family lipid kinase n=1 Tax=Mucilaginibacter rubeus TaxID=2027860 RepID=A0AAE6JM34_9SPHI|nr:diacylglycerol kinase family protein [Mucilaginibacter rubeus]QEM07082.1 diacylglycerol kinase family lipid kinase [Mucilaginibacter rubeus]
MKSPLGIKILFIINPGSGCTDTDWHLIIKNFFKTSDHAIELFQLTVPCLPESVQEKIKSYLPDKVVAVGGDGTVKMVAQYLQETKIPLGIIPAGSANGLAKELMIPEDPIQALDVIVTGGTKRVHLVKINDHLCIHLSDIGFNAYMIKKFDTGNDRGMWGYVKASWKVFWNKPTVRVTIQTDSTSIKRYAAMIVIANATRYGTGALINPIGRLDDEVFEVIILKRISIAEIFKMMITHTPYDYRKTEILQTKTLFIQTEKTAHFQVDGEYLGVLNEIRAYILPNALTVIIP